jgi:hypothetical protein
MPQPSFSYLATARVPSAKEQYFFLGHRCLILGDAAQACDQAFDI